MKGVSKNLMVTVSGGRSSAMMARHIQQSELYTDYNKVYVFANTGQERYETIAFLSNIVNIWGIPLNIVEAVGSNVMGVGVSYQLVDFGTLNMDSKPFADVVMHKNKGTFDGLPNQASPYCSESLKTIPCKKFCDTIFGVNNYVKALGYRKEDMPRRITFAEAKEDKKRIFPLLTDFAMPINNLDLNRWWDMQPFQLGIHGQYGNCELCWKKPTKTLIANLRYGSRSVEWWRTMEKQYGNTAFRDNKSINDLVRLSQLPYTPEFEFNDFSDGCVCAF